MAETNTAKRNTKRETMNPEKAVNIIAAAVKEALSVIAIAAREAKQVVASDVSDATHLLANNAADAARVASTKNEGDHDLLIELRTEMKGLRTDIRELKDGTNDRITDHETRLVALEKSKTIQNTLMSIGIGLLSLLVGLLLFHLFKS